jgi:transposase
MSNKKTYTKEFKLGALSLVLEQGYKGTEAAKSLGIHESVLRRWLKEHKELNDSAFKGDGKLSQEQEEIRRLREENKRLRMEKEILKKAAAFFAQETN